MMGLQNKRSSFTTAGISSVRRKTNRLEERTNNVISMWKKLPTFSREEIRKHRMPYDQAILVNLKEAGYPQSAMYITNLINYQNEYRQSHYYDLKVMARPLLKNSCANLDTLSESLKKMEILHFQSKPEREFDVMLTLAAEYISDHADWWWIGEQLINTCLKLVPNCNSDGGLRYAEVNYIYGKYLIKQGSNPMKGMYHLEVAKLKSENRPWTAVAILKKPELSIFTEVSRLMYSTLAEEVTELLLVNPIEAIDLFWFAKEIGINSCVPKSHLYFLQGKCEMEIGRPELAVESFTISFHSYKSNRQPDKACEASIRLALAYLQMGNWQRTNDVLHTLLDYAEKHKLMSYVGLAYLYTGQYFLNHGIPVKATPNLVTALNIFVQLNDVANIEFAENLHATSQGQEMFSDYTSLILRASKDGVKQLRDLNRLCDWKDKRVNIWDEKSEASIIEIEQEETEECASGTTIENNLEEEVVNKISHVSQ